MFAKPQSFGVGLRERGGASGERRRRRTRESARGLGQGWGHQKPRLRVAWEGLDLNPGPCRNRSLEKAKGGGYLEAQGRGGA